MESKKIGEKRKYNTQLKQIEQIKLRVAGKQFMVTFKT